MTAQVAEGVARPRRGRPPGSKNKPKPVAVVADGAVAGLTYVARKPMRVAGRMVRAGDVVPEAGSWPRVESWVRAGFLDVRE